MRTSATIGALAVIAVTALAACDTGQTPGPSASPPATTSSGRSYDLGRGEIYKQAFWQFTGTGTPWQKACETVVADRQAVLVSQPWWNRDDALRGCLASGNGAVSGSGSTAPASQPAPPQECTPQDGNQIKVYNGAISCADAYALAKRYDLQGQKYQEINSVDTWTCYSGVADTRPLIYTCVSDQGAEFGVYPAP